MDGTAAGRRAAEPRRAQWPRPLPLHLAAAGAAWGGAMAGLPAARAGLVPWPAGLETPGRALAAELAAADPAALGAALGLELRRRADLFLTGLERYRAHPYRRTLVDPPVLWTDGTARLLDFGPDGAPPVLVVPSLVNRSAILDLSERTSLMRGLAGRGVRPLLLDWGVPGERERGRGLAAYVEGPLSAAFAVARGGGHRPLLLGYCMGGLLAVALAALHPGEAAGLALLAVPWDFHAERVDQTRLLVAGLAPLWPSMEAAGEMPVDLLQGLFAGLDPMLVLRKFSAFAALNPDSDEAQAFVALEDWANDGVPLALPLARECVEDWYDRNLPGRGRWRVAGVPVDPASLALPALVVVPGRDRIVPPASAEALAAALPRAEVLRPSLGHVGMMASPRAGQAVHAPLADWLLRAAE